MEPVSKDQLVVVDRNGAFVQGIGEIGCAVSIDGHVTESATAADILGGGYAWFTVERIAFTSLYNVPQLREHLAVSGLGLRSARANERLAHYEDEMTTKSALAALARARVIIPHQNGEPLRLNSPSHA